MTRNPDLKKIVEEGISDAVDAGAKRYRRTLIEEVEMLLANRCYSAEVEADAAGISYKCACPKIQNLTTEELESILAERGGW